MQEATFRFALKGSPQVLSASDGVTAILGFTPQAFLSSEVRLEDRIHPHDSDIADPIFSPDIQLGCGTFSLRVRHADGHIRCFRARCKKEARQESGITLDFTIEDGRPDPSQLDHLDTSGVVKAVMESLDDCVYLKDTNHVLIAANLKSRQVLTGADRPPLDLVGMTDYDLFPDEIADRYFKFEKQILAGMPNGHEVEESIGKNGNKIWFDIRRYPIKANSGEIVGILGIATDITQGVIAEQNSREVAESLQEAQKIAGLGSYVLDIPTGRWKSSEVLDQIFGMDAAFKRDVAGWVSLIHPDDRDCMAAYFAEEVVGKRTRFDHEYRILRGSDGAERWVHGLGRLDFDLDGKPVTMRGTIQDITERKQSEAKLRESQELLQLFIQHAPAALAMFDSEMRYLAVSRRWLEMHELNGQSILGRSHYEVLPAIPAAWRAEHHRALEGVPLQAAEDSFIQADSKIQWVRREIRPWFAGDGTVGGIVIFSEDITERRHAEERLHLAASVFTHASEGIVITDADGAILDVNESFTNITGYARDEVLGRNPSLLSSGRQTKEFYANMWRDLIENGQWAGEIWNRAKDGRVFIEMLTITAVRDQSGKTRQYVALFSDLTSIKEQEQRLERIAHYDLLTGLPNRVLLHDRLHQAMAQAHRRGMMVAVACLDLDDFKTINDLYGHATGDRLLTAITHRMKLALREDDTLARLGGDEFIAVLSEVAGIEESTPILNGLLSGAAEPVQIDDRTLQVSASIGVAYFPQTEDVDADQLLRQAGQAMYQSKLEGKNRCHVFDPRLDRNVRGHHEDLERVRIGLKANEFVLHYQPKVNMATGETHGVEALIRWQHPERGLLPPSEFLPVVEGHSLAVELGEWVIGSALSQIEAWKNQGISIPVSVNISAHQLQQADFVERLRALLARHPKIPPSSLELELLESTALMDIALVSQVIQDCNRLGVSFALDDFGTGYSSLAYLKRLPVDALKIDQTFIRDMLDDPEDLTIVEGMLGLASAFRRKAVAEGVETIEHGLVLLRLGCQVAQGFGIARPMPGANFAGWLKSWRPDPQWLQVAALDPADRPLLYAGAEHSALVAAMDEFLQGKRRVPPALGPNQCRFGSWMNSAVTARRGPLAVFEEIASIHLQLHSLASDIFGLVADNQHATAVNQLVKLHALRDSLLEELDALMQRD